MTLSRININTKNPRQQAINDLLLLIVCGLIGAFLGALLTKGVLYLADIDNVQDTVAALTPDAPAAERNLIRAILMIGHLFLFWLSSLAFAYFLYKKQFLEYLQLHQTPSLSNLSASVFIVFISIPVVFLTYWLNQHIPISDSLMEYEKEAELLTQQLLVMNSPWELLFNLVVIALVPAVGEELMFRGIIQNLMTKLAQNEHLGVWIAGFIFSAIHFQFQGFLPRMFLGVLLGYFLMWTKNLWIPIFAHFVFNGIQLIAQYFAEVNIEEQEPDIEKLLPFSLFSLILVIGLCWLMYRQNKNINP